MKPAQKIIWKGYIKKKFTFYKRWTSILLQEKLTILSHTKWITYRYTVAYLKSGKTITVAKVVREISI